MIRGRRTRHKENVDTSPQGIPKKKVTSVRVGKKKSPKSTEKKPRIQKPKVTSNFHEVCTISSSESEHVSDDEKERSSNTVGAFDKIFKNIGRQLGHQKVATSLRTRAPVLDLTLSSDDDDSCPSKPVPPKPIAISKEYALRLELYAKEERELDDIIASCNKTIRDIKNPAPQGKKKRTAKQLPRDDNDIEVIEHKPAVFDVTEDSLEAGPAPVMSYLIRVNYQSKLIVFKLAETDRCFEIRRILGDKVQENPEDLIIGYEDDVGKAFYDHLTLKEASITPGVMLEAFQKVKVPGSKPNPKIKDPLLIRIKIQSSHRRSQAFYEIRKTDKFSKLQELYAAKNDVQPNQVRFKFDGDVVDMDDTPEGLDLDGDEVFDVFILENAPKK